MSSKQPIYVYDSRTQFSEPLFVLYDFNHINPVITAVFGNPVPEFIFVTTMRRHKYALNDPYLGKTVSNKKFKNH